MRHPNRWDLDQASTDHPIYIGHISGHLGVGNSLGIEMAGVTRDTPQPFGGKIRMDDVSGEPNGVLEEPPAMSRVSHLLPQFSEDDLVDAVAHAAREYAAMGVTTAQQGATAPNGADLFVRAYREGRLPIRVHVWPVIQAMVGVIENGDVLDHPDADGMVSYRALKGITLYAAYQSFEENEKGTVETGKLADLVVLGRNPLEAPPLDLDDTSVLRTIVGGRTVFERQTF